MWQAQSPSWRGLQAAWSRSSAGPRHFRLASVPKRGGGRFGVQAEVRHAEREQTLAKLETRMGELREKAAQGGENLSAGASDLLDETKESMTRLRQELAGVGSVTKDRWNDFKSGFGKGVDELNRKLDNALR